MNKLSPQTNKKGINNLLLLLAIGCLLPLFILSIYNQPANDDYTYALRDMDGSIWSTIVDTYLTWSGRYFATAIASLNPLTYHSLTAYQLYPIGLLLLFISSIYLLVYSWLHRVVNPYSIVGLTALLLILYLIKAPSISESFYWFSGYAAYTIPMLLFCGILALLRKKKNVCHFTLATLLIVAIVGSNEISAVITTLLLGAICIEYYLQKKQVNWYFLGLALVAALCILIVILSPGNAIRMEGQVSSSNWIWTIGGSFLQSCSWFVLWAPTLLLVTFIYIPVWGLKLANTDLPFLKKIQQLPFTRLFIYFCSILFIAHIPPTYGLGTVVIGRIANVIYLYYIVGWFFLVQLLIFQHKEKIETYYKHRLAWVVTYGLLFVFIFNNVLSLNNNIGTSYVDLITGKAYHYSIEMQNRYKIMKDNQSSNDTIVLPALEYIPQTIYFNDLSDETDYWANKDCQTYWNCKPSILLHKINRLPTSNFEQLKAFGKKIRRKKFSKKE